MIEISQSKVRMVTKNLFWTISMRAIAVAVLSGAVVFGAAPVWAGDDAHPFKLTLGDYQYPDYQGRDVNLRWQHENSHAWVGHYQDDFFGSQSRAGVDTSVDLSALISIQPSLQAATGGFWGGSLNTQIGHAWYALAGIGRTNLKPYVNLNFDPNDAVTLGGGHLFDGGQNWSLFMVHDDRLQTRQTAAHLSGRIPVGPDRLTIDLARKSGNGDTGYIRAWSATVGWDFPRWFLRLARDNRQNFAADDVWRFAGGIRF